MSRKTEQSSSSQALQLDANIRTASDSLEFFDGINKYLDKM